MKKRPKFNPRKLMELAIKAMRQSVHEPRDDGKDSPKVGVVLWKPDGTIETACRGELRHGDHAEFTVLERKNRSSRLDGSVLFATLEPCAPDSRHPPKMSCAERIALARIQEVWVGIADPDPTVDRKGIKYLQNQNITVHMFDRDLQDLIRAENKKFFAQALKRAAEAEKETPEKVTLSTLENALDATTTDDLSNEALERYRLVARIESSVGSLLFNRRLVMQGLLKQKGNRFTPTGFGMLLFGKEPRVAMPQAGVLATIHYPDGTEELEDFDEAMVLIPKRMEKWLGSKLPNVIDRSAMQRKVLPSLPFEMVREAVVNALIHRDYDRRQAKCQLIVTADTITVKSPGQPVEPITLENLQKFAAPMLSRNPELHYVFARMELAEERGFGLRSLKNRAQKLGLPLPRYSWADPYIVLTLYRNKEAAARTLDSKVLASLSKAEQAGWQWIATRDSLTRSEYANAMNIPARTALNHLERFIKLTLVRRVGSGRTTRYEVIP